MYTSRLISLPTDSGCADVRIVISSVAISDLGVYFKSTPQRFRILPIQCGSWFSSFHRNANSPIASMIDQRSSILQPNHSSHLKYVARTNFSNPHSPTVTFGSLSRSIISRPFSFFGFPRYRFAATLPSLPPFICAPVRSVPHRLFLPYATESIKSGYSSSSVAIVRPWVK